MPRPVVTPLFAARLKHAREERGWTMGQVVSRIHRQDTALDSFTTAQLSRYEWGQVAMPDPVAISALASLYGLELSTLIELLQDDRNAAKRAAGHSPPERRPVRARRAGR